MVNNGRWEFQTAEYDDQVIITLIRLAQPGMPHTEDRIDATFSLSDADKCAAAVEAAINRINDEVED